MNITYLIARILLEAVTVGNGILGFWVVLPANASGPYDPNIVLTTSGSDMVAYLASSAIRASDIVCAVIGILF